MVIGRGLGWVFIALALLMASGDVVLALSPGDHAHLAIGDVWLLLSGRISHDGETGSALTALAMAVPAWLTLGAVGSALLTVCRPRRRRYFRSVR